MESGVWTLLEGLRAESRPSMPEGLEGRVLERVRRSVVVGDTLDLVTLPFRGVFFRSVLELLTPILGGQGAIQRASESAAGTARGSDPTEESRAEPVEGEIVGTGTAADRS